MFTSLSEFYDWFSGRNENNDFQVDIAPLDELDGWGADPDTGTLRHRSGKFFSVEGLAVEAGSELAWSQPIINQPEIGILGIIVQRKGGSYYCLMQAKMEPGNVNLIQLSPTVQATRSNYMRVHQGNAVPYLEYFVSPPPSGVVFDSLQSEQGSWFLGKRNRNMIVEISDWLPPLEDFCWLRLDLLSELMRVPNLVNMDSRTVLSGLPFLDRDRRSFQTGERRPFSRHSFPELLSWFTEVKARRTLERYAAPLQQLPGWDYSSRRIERPDGKHFAIIGVDVKASNREVGQWSQPMLQPAGQGVIAFIGRYFEGTFHVLVNARTEAGTADIVEMGPTVACIPANYRNCPEEEKPPFLDVVLDSDPSEVLVDTVHSEEGGRFFQAESRYVVVDAGEEFSGEIPDDFCWMSVAQLTEFVQFGNHVNVAARCLLSCIGDGVVDNAVISQ